MNWEPKKKEKCEEKRREEKRRKEKRRKADHIDYVQYICMLYCTKNPIKKQNNNKNDGNRNKILEKTE